MEKSISEIVKQIHNEFDDSINQLLDYCDIQHKKSNEIKIEEEKHNKCKKLQSLGFNNSTIVREVSQKWKNVNSLKEKAKIKDNVQNIIKEFPGYKVITYSQVLQLCEKWNLYISKSSNYISDIPDKNVEDMVIFNNNFSKKRNFINSIDPLFKMKFQERNYDYDYRNHREPYNNTPQYYICANRSDFDKNLSCIGREIINEPLEKNNYVAKITYPDPIVLVPVDKTEDDILFVIVTAWGDEASDSLVLNEKNN